MKNVFLTSTIIPLYLAVLSIEHDKVIFAVLSLIVTGILLFKAGVADPE